MSRITPNRFTRDAGATAAVLSGLVWLALTPFMATVGLCGTICGLWSQQPLVVRTLGRAAADWEWIPTNVDPDALYFGYGRWFVLFYALLIIGLLALRHVQLTLHAPQGKLDQLGYRLLLGSFTLAALGDFTSYGIGVFSKTAWRIGFGIEVFSWLGVIVGGIMYGVALLRQRVFHPIVGALLAIAASLLPVTFFDRVLVHYSPNAQMLPFALAWPILGVCMLREGFSLPSHRRKKDAS